ncbi:MAG: hypothetical protein ACJ761_10700, partial [Chloroflexota bacterium]
DGVFFLKDWSENADVAAAFMASGLIELALDVESRVAGGSGTAFGVPSVIVEADRVPVGQAEAKRLAGLVEAAWAAFDRTAATSPASLRKGPRGGGRDRDKMVRHVNEADSAYARETGAPVRLTDASDRSAVKAMREGMLEVLRRPSDGAPLDGGRWTQRFATRRVAWHALDHAWEMEDRSTPE